MSFFKKKRFGSDVEGYERITRMIEGREQDVDDDEFDEDLDDDTVLLTPQARAQREPVAESVSVVRAPDTRTTSGDGGLRGERSDAGTTTPARMPVPEMPAAASGASLVSKDAVWDGKLQCNGDVRIEGVIQGEVETGGVLYVTADARVFGTVRARNVVLAGEIEGQLRCEERLEILPGGSARGEIDTGSLVVHEGAFIESRFQMHSGATPAGRP